MKTICVTAQKGGAGKTTLARNLAVNASLAGQRVLLIDLDPQHSLRKWWQHRESEQPTMLATDPTPQQIGPLKASALAGEFDLAIIDTPPAAPEWLVDVLEASDLALIPVRPSHDDLEALGATLGAMARHGTPYAFVLSQALRSAMTGKTVRALARRGRLAPENIWIRTIYSETGATGEGVAETRDTKASAEIQSLWNYVSEELL